MLRRRTAALLPLFALASACSAVVPVLDAPASYITARAPEMVWITKADNSVVQLASPKVMGDTLAGFVGMDYVEMPLSNVQSLRARQRAPKRTALLIGGVTLATAGAIAAYLTRSANATQTPECMDPEPEVNC
ncbi:MAG: hypothetical protein DMD49_04020 [Gemmatimonadetes bacterium]|nr:MAG: hypothetical protein DMD49_04020 [Gemmatimonadota bacterium]